MHKNSGASKQTVKSMSKMLQPMWGTISLNSLLMNIAWMLQSITYLQTSPAVCTAYCLAHGARELIRLPVLPHHSKLNHLFLHMSHLFPSSCLPLSLSVCPISAVKSRQGRPGLLGKTPNGADRSQVNWMETGSSCGGVKKSAQTHCTLHFVLCLQGKIERWSSVNFFIFFLI